MYIDPKIPLFSNHPSFTLPIPATTDRFTVSVVLPLPECHILIVEIIQYVAFSDWLFPLNYMHLRFFHVFPWFDSSFIFSTE